MWSSNSTNKWAVVIVALSLCGCASHRDAASPAPVRGTADLNVLVRSHPGWRGVAQFDGALALLHTAQGTARAGSDPTLTRLPAEDAPAAFLPPAVLEAQRQRLAALQAAQVARLQERRARARAAQIDALRAGGMRDAQAQYAASVAAAQRAYGRQARASLAANGTRRLNLVLQVNALSDTVSAWKLSVPPTPALNAAKRELAEKRALLAALDKTQAQTLAAARGTRDMALAAALSARNGFVDALAAQADARAHAADAAQAAALEQRLSAQRQALLQAQDVRPLPSVTATGDLANELLPPDPVVAALSAQQAARSASRLGEARAKLAAQRARWVAFLMDDTRAAALDAARQHHWQLTFAPARAGTTDLTRAVEQALTRDTWKQGQKETRT